MQETENTPKPNDTRPHCLYAIEVLKKPLGVTVTFADAARLSLGDTVMAAGGVPVKPPALV